MTLSVLGRGLLKPGLHSLGCPWASPQSCRLLLTTLMQRFSPWGHILDSNHKSGQFIHTMSYLSTLICLALVTTYHTGYAAWHVHMNMYTHWTTHISATLTPVQGPHNVHTVIALYIIYVRISVVSEMWWCFLHKKKLLLFLSITSSIALHCIHYYSWYT